MSDITAEDVRAEVQDKLSVYAAAEKNPIPLEKAVHQHQVEDFIVQMVMDRQTQLDADAQRVAALERERDDLRHLADSVDAMTRRPVSFAALCDSIDSKDLESQVYHTCIWHMRRAERAEQQLRDLRERVRVFLDGEEFDSVAYAYRTAPSTDQAWVIRAFEAVKAAVLALLPAPPQETCACGHASGFHRWRTGACWGATGNLPCTCTKFAPEGEKG